MNRILVPLAFLVLARAAVADDRARLEKAAARAEALDRAFAAARGALERTRFEPVALAATLDDLEAAFLHVRDRIGLEVYRGSLRGAAGTLGAASGNPLDRALLVQALLAAAGGETRIVSATLSAPEVEQVLRACRLAPARPAGGSTFEPFRDLVDPEEVERRREESARAGEALLGKVHRHTRMLAGVLEAAGAGLEAEGARLDLSAEARTHYWVQARNGAGGAWIDLDPTLPSARPGERFAGARERVIPPAKLEALAVRVGFALAADVRVGKRIETRPLLSISLPVPEATGERIVLSIVPGGDLEAALDGPGTEDRWKAALDPIDTWQPIVRYRDESIAGRPFDLSGQVYQVGRGGDLESLALAAGDLLGGLGGGPAPRPDGLVALRLVLTIPGPDGKTRTHRRTLAERSSDGALEGDALRHWKLALSPSVAVLVLGGPIEETAVADRILRAETARAGAIRRALAMGLGKEAPRPASELVGGLDPYPNELLAFALAREALLAEVLARAGGGRAAYAAPNVVLHHVGFHGEVEGKVVLRRGLDVVENALRIEGAGPEAALLAGVADTVLEEAIVAGASCVPVVNTARAFESLDGSALRVIQGKGADLSALPLSPAARAAIAADLAAGRLAVVSTRDLEADAWWSIDPKTGAAIGRCSGGEGAAMTEYAMEAWKYIKIRGALLPAVFCGLALGAVKNGYIYEGLAYCVLSFMLPTTWMREATWNVGALVGFIVPYVWAEWLTSD